MCSYSYWRFIRYAKSFRSNMRIQNTFVYLSSLFLSKKSRVWSVSNVFANAIFTCTLDLINWWDVQIAAFPLRAPIRHISYVCISEIRYSFIYKFGHLIYIRRSKELRKTIPLAQRFAYAKRLILFIWKEKAKRGMKKIEENLPSRDTRVSLFYY